VNEESMGLFFAKYGPIGTVKIMWRTSLLSPNPNQADTLARGEDELLAVRKGRGALTGFINFMAREDAAKALNELDGLDWGGNQIRVAWGKPMPLPIEPIYGELNVALPLA
jgi:U2-associated protein SR140